MENFQRVFGQAKINENWSGVSLGRDKVGK